MRENIEAYVLIAVGLVMLGFWAKALMDGNTTELFIADENSAKEGDGVFETAQRYRLLIAGAAFALGIYGLTVGFE